MSKPFSNNPMQKGKRRVKLHKNQNNVGNKKNKPEYKNYDGEELD